MQVRDFGCAKIRTPQNGSNGGAGAPGRVRHTLIGLEDVGEGVGRARRRPTRGSAESNGADQNVLSYEILHAVKRDGLLVYSLGPWWNYRSWRRHFGNAPACCSTERASTASDREPPPIYIDHACRKPREYAARSGNASFFLGR
jgi:hypothetical protein